MRLRASVALLCFASFFLTTAFPATAAERAGSSASVTAQGSRLGKPTLKTRPVAIGNGYSLYVETYMSVVGVVIKKSDTDSEQYYTWSFSDHLGDVRSNDSLSVVTMDSTLTSDDATGASGSISLRSNRKLPGDPTGMSGCKGVKYEWRGGTLDGTFSFETGTDLFGKIEMTSLPLKYARRTVGPTACTPPPENCGGTMLDFLVLEASGTIQAVRKATVATLQARIVNYFPKGWATKVLKEKIDVSNVQIASDLSTGTVQGSGAITGSMTHEAYEGMAEGNNGYCNGNEIAYGTPSGQMTLGFDTGELEVAPENYSTAWRYKA